MELRQLKSLCLIAQHDTVKEAAKRSFPTSSAVSLQIKALEQELGVKLFEHAGKKLVLTSRGESLYQDAQRILEFVREARERTVAETGEFTGRISEIKRYVASKIGVGIIYNICVDAEDSGRLRSIPIDKFFRHPEGTLIYRRPKILSSGEKKLIEFMQTTPLN